MRNEEWTATTNVRRKDHRFRALKHKFFLSHLKAQEYINISTQSMYAIPDPQATHTYQLRQGKQ